MKGHNAKFRANPKRYLRSNAIACYNMGTGQLKKDAEQFGVDVLSATCDLTLEFDLVPARGYVDLKILGLVGQYSTTSRKGAPLVARWIPYLGQKKVADPDQFGKINLNTVRTDLVFTVGFSGCQFTVVNYGGGKWVYHEPTAESWGGRPNYAGNVVLQAPPAYDDDAGIIGGFGCLVRSGGTWKALVQTVKGIKVVQVDEYVIP